MPLIPGTITLTQPANLSSATAADQRNDHTQIQTAVNGLIAWATASGPAALAKAGGVYDLNTSTTESSLVSGATASGTTGFKIPANTMGSFGALRFTLIGDVLNNTGGSVNLTLKILFGGSVYWGDLKAFATAGATRGTLWVDFMLGNDGTATASHMAGLVARPLGSAPTAGSVAGFSGNPTDVIPVNSGVKSVDTTVDCYLDVTAKWGTSDLNASIRRIFAAVSVL